MFHSSLKLKTQHGCPMGKKRGYIYIFTQIYFFTWISSNQQNQSTWIIFKVDIAITKMTIKRSETEWLLHFEQFLVVSLLSKQLTKETVGWQSIFNKNVLYNVCIKIKTLAFPHHLDKLSDFNFNGSENCYSGYLTVR